MRQPERVRSADAWIDTPQETPAGYFDPRFQKRALKVLPGEFVATSRDVMLVTVLGSCVSACLRDPVAQVGGMNHFMLPDGEQHASARYGGYAMEVLINELFKRGARRERLEAKVFGGGAVIAGMTTLNVGERNAEFVLGYLKLEHIRLVAQDLLDTCARRVHYFPLTGQALVRHLRAGRDAEVLASERLYRHRPDAAAPAAGSVELF